MDLTIALSLIIILPIICLVGGGAAGFFLTKKMFEKQIRENPPITEKQIRAMFMSMGRKPSESQIRSVMRSMQNTKNKN